MTSPPPGPGAPAHGGGLPRGTLLFLTAASVMIVIAGLREASSLVVPIVLAGFFALVCFPAMRGLQRRRVPTSLAIGVVVTVATVVSLTVVTLISTSLQQFGAMLPNLQEQLQKIQQDVIEDLQGFDVFGHKIFAKFAHEDVTTQLGSLLDPGLIMNVVSGAASEVVTALSNLFVIILLMVFMLVEANGLGAKIARATHGSGPVLAELSNIKKQVSGYVSIKVATSLATGVMVSLLAWATDLSLPLLWGFVAFLFNFVPNIGSIIAAIPPILLALVEHGVASAGVVLLGYLVIGMVIGNVIEPRVMGSRLGLSTLVVFLSLIFWSWVWGPIGMLLSVPLTVVVKIVFEHIDDFRPIAVLLGPDRDVGDA